MLVLWTGNRILTHGQKYQTEKCATQPVGLLTFTTDIMQCITDKVNGQSAASQSALMILNFVFI